MSTTIGVIDGVVIGSEIAVAFEIFDSDVSVEIGDGHVAWTCPAFMSGMNLTDVIASIHTLGADTGSDTMDIQVRRRRAGSDVDMLTNKITMLDTEYYANDGTVNAANDDISTGDQIYIDVDSMFDTTAPLGLSVTLTFTWP